MLKYPRRLLRAFILLAATLVGCAGPGPRMFPPAPISETRDADGLIERRYDTDGDGRPDFAEHVGRDGIIDVIRYDPRGDGSFDDVVERLKLEPGECRDLLLILDSVPYGMVKEMRDAGRFRYFHPSARVIAPFPVMTDVSLAEFFGVSPCPGVEAAYYDGQRVTAGFNGYASEADTPWVRCTDYRMAPINHLVAYFYPNGWLGHELRGIQDAFLQNARGQGAKGSRGQATEGLKAAWPPFIGYCVCTSGLGTMEGRDGHHDGLTRVDRFCQYLMKQTRGRVRITLMSDHGHFLAHSRRVALADRLAALGYRVRSRLEKDGDVVPIEFGLVGMAAIHTRQPAAVARDCIGIDGVELSAYHDDAANKVVVLSRDGCARITRVGDGFAYEPDYGDPLRLLPILKRFGRRVVSDRDLFEATKLHDYPDGVYALWRAFHGLVQHRPDVLLSLNDGRHCGSTTIQSLYYYDGIHGSLNRDSSSGFCMTTAGALPDVVRMADLRAALRDAGVDLSRRGASLNRTAASTAQE